MAEYVARLSQRCPRCGHNEYVWYNYQIHWLCWWCLEICYQSILQELPPDNPQPYNHADIYERAVELYCIMAQSTYSLGH
jgi:hypothetical protein